MWQADVGNAIKWGEDTEIAEVKERQPALLQQLLKIWEQVREGNAPLFYPAVK